MTPAATRPTPPSAPRLSVTLSRDELAFVLRALRIPGIPGFDTTWAGGDLTGELSESARASVRAGGAALAARGYLAAKPRPGDSRRPVELDLPAPVIAFTGSCALSDYTVVLSLVTPAGRSDAYLHECQGLGIVHWMPTRDVHGFQALDGRAGVLRALERALGLGQQVRAGCPVGVVAFAAVQAARDACVAGRRGEAPGILTGVGLAPATAHALAAALADAAALGALAVLAHGESDVMAARRAVAFACGREHCFALELPRPGAQEYAVTPVSADELRRWLAASVPARGR
jgi:hypothetical protein